MKSIAATVAVLALFAGSGPAEALGPQDYIGSMGPVAFPFCPRGTMEADGRLLPIAQYQALFSLLGTQYGGDGRQDFALPDMSKELKKKGPSRYCIVVEGIFPSRS